ncbi:hypothetical protein ACFYUY_21510 [Kitasatospora sp. NPDC004745]|uniref:hypothetical protein n=1 Tax=unclassified Kitasatospora TaxID=2633591 RepID=UPI0033E3CC4C
MTTVMEASRFLLFGGMAGAGSYGVTKTPPEGGSHTIMLAISVITCLVGVIGLIATLSGN